jgi:hypothetical protein
VSPELFRNSGDIRLLKNISGEINFTQQLESTVLIIAAGPQNEKPAARKHSS